MLVADQDGAFPRAGADESDTPADDVPSIPPDVVEVKQSPRTDYGNHAPAGFEGAPGSAALATFLRFHPFTGFFIWLADMQYPAAHSADLRVSQHKTQCPRLYWVCVVFDFILTGAAAIGLLALIAVVAYKAVR